MVHTGDSFAAPENAGEDFVPDPHLDAEARDPEAPTADAVEQATPAYAGDQPGTLSRGLEVDEYDALEQSQVVDMDDDYR